MEKILVVFVYLSEASIENKRLYLGNLQTWWVGSSCVVTNLHFLGMFYRRGPASQEEPDRREDGVWLRAAVRESKVLILSPSLIRSDVFML